MNFEIKIKALCLIFAFIFFSSTLRAQAKSVDVDLSDDSVWFQYNQMLIGEKFSNAELSGSFMYNTSDSRLFTVGLEMVEEVTFMTTWFDVGVGGKLFFGNVDDNDFLNLGLGGRLRYVIPKIKQVSIGANAYYAPEIVSFFDSKGLWKVGFQINYNILEQSSVYFGYRAIKTDLNKKKDVTIDKGVYLGLQISF